MSTRLERKVLGLVYSIRSQPETAATQNCIHKGCFETMQTAELRMCDAREHPVGMLNSFRIAVYLAKPRCACWIIFSDTKTPTKGM